MNNNNNYNNLFIFYLRNRRRVGMLRLGPDMWIFRFDFLLRIHIYIEDNLDQ